MPRALHATAVFTDATTRQATSKRRVSTHASTAALTAVFPLCESCASNHIFRLRCSCVNVQNLRRSDAALQDERGACRVSILSPFCKHSLPTLPPRPQPRLEAACWPTEGFAGWGFRIGVPGMRSRNAKRNAELCVSRAFPFRVPRSVNLASQSPPNTLLPGAGLRRQFVSVHFFVCPNLTNFQHELAPSMTRSGKWR